MVPAHFHWCRSVLINPFLILWAFHLTLDRMKPDDMRFLYVRVPDVRYPIDFKWNVLDMELSASAQVP
ncbi:hypothetical protein P692DRAFT_20576391 [Suillus brevipes Sb2]|nr:hypothetical protein P692DRAFT_20576391 [Suillus brevipes Sb2]